MSKSSVKVYVLYVRFFHRDPHPTLSWQDAGLLMGCVVISDDEDASMTCTDKEEEGPDIEILEEPTKNAIKNQAISGIRLV